MDYHFRGEPTVEGGDANQRTWLVDSQLSSNQVSFGHDVSVSTAGRSSRS